MKTSKAIIGEDIEIPELEEAMKTYAPKNKCWTQKELTILYRYFRKVPIELLAKYLPGRSIPAIDQKAESLLIHKREDTEPKED